MIAKVIDNSPTDSGVALLSDNAAGVHPEVFAAMGAANGGYAAAYGGDDVTARAVELLRTEFGADAQVALTTTGTAANVLGLRAVADSFHAVVCATSAHLNRDECGAPEHFTGCKLLTVPASEGLIDVPAIEPLLAEASSVQRVQPRVVSISQCSELGTVYSPSHLRRLADWCHAHDMLLQVDGARLANAAAALDCSLGEAAGGADLVSFGCSKNGAMNAESVLLLTPAARTAALGFHQKQAMQLSSKMRFVAAQVVAMLTDELWRRNARHANAMAQRLAGAVSAVPGARLAVGQVTNAVFAQLPDRTIERLRERASFHVWDAAAGVVRLMASYETTAADVERFVADLSWAARG